MCNRYGYLAPVSRLVDEFSQAKIPLRFAFDATPNIAARDPVRPTDSAPVVRAPDPSDPGAAVELIEARLWLVPFFHKGPVKDWKPLCTNARSETVASTPSFREAYRRRRRLVPASHWFEFL